jgi:hypothetical protein
LQAQWPKCAVHPAFGETAHRSISPLHHGNACTCCQTHKGTEHFG